MSHRMSAALVVLRVVAVAVSVVALVAAAELQLRQWQHEQQKEQERCIKNISCSNSLATVAAIIAISVVEIQAKV